MKRRRAGAFPPVFTRGAGALARNSDRLDGIVTGVERLTASGPAPPPSKIITLQAPQTFPALEPAQGQLAVPDPTALLMLGIPTTRWSSAPAD